MDNKMDKYEQAMQGIHEKMAMQAIRGIVREKNTSDEDKLNDIIRVVNSFVNDAMTAAKKTDWQTPFEDLFVKKTWKTTEGGNGTDT